MKQQPMKKIFGLYLAIVGVVIIIIGLIMAGMETGGWVLFWGTGFVIICIGVWGFNNSGTKEGTSTTNSVMDENNEAMQEQDNKIETINELNIGGIKIEKEATKPIDTIHEILIDEGFRPMIYSNGNYIEFKIEGDVIRIQFYEDDENFIQLGSLVYDYEQEYKNAALDTANRVNIRVKYAWIALHSNQIIAHSDLFFDSNMDIKTVLLKHISTVLCAKDEFYKISNELKLSLN